MSKSLIALVAAVAALAIVVAGCGSGSDSTTGGTEATTSSLTKAEFLKQGNAICAKGNETLEAGFEKWAKENNVNEKKEPTKAELTQAAEEVLIPDVRNQIEEIRALGLPKEGGEEADAVLTAAEKGLEEGEEEPLALTDENNTAFAEANKLAREFGLVKCGEEGNEG